jgi:hypothetical protein
VASSSMSHAMTRGPCNIYWGLRSRSQLRAEATDALFDKSCMVSPSTCYGLMAKYTDHSFSEVENLRENVSDKKLEGAVHFFLCWR